MKISKNKKGQFYIITAILLIAFAFQSVQSVKQQKPRDSFKELYQNYINEAPAALNNNNLADFTGRFLEYARTIDPNFELAYVAALKNKTEAYNGFKKEIYINDVLMNINESVEINASRGVTISAGKMQYQFSVISPEINALFRSESDNDVRVYVYD